MTKQQALKEMYRIWDEADLSDEEIAEYFVKQNPDCSAELAAAFVDKLQDKADIAYYIGKDGKQKKLATVIEG